MIASLWGGGVQGRSLDPYSEKSICGLLGLDSGQILDGRGSGPQRVPINGAHPAQLLHLNQVCTYWCPHPQSVSICKVRKNIHMHIGPD